MEKNFPFDKFDELSLKIFYSDKKNRIFVENKKK